MWEQTPPPHRPHAAPAPLASPVHPLTAARAPPVALFLEQSSSPSGYPTHLMACLMFASLPAGEPHERGRPITPEPTHSPVWTAGHCRLQPDGDTSVDTSPQLASWPPSAQAAQQGRLFPPSPRHRGQSRDTGAHLSRGDPSPSLAWLLLPLSQKLPEQARPATCSRALRGAVVRCVPP